MARRVLAFLGIAAGLGLGVVRLVAGDRDITGGLAFAATYSLPGWLALIPQRKAVFAAGVLSLLLGLTSLAGVTLPLCFIGVGYLLTLPPGRSAATVAIVILGLGGFALPLALGATRCYETVRYDDGRTVRTRDYDSERSEGTAIYGRAERPGEASIEHSCNQGSVTPLGAGLSLACATGALVVARSRLPAEPRQG